MAVIHAAGARVHELHGVRFTALASPSSGSTELMAWQTEVPVGAPVTPHQVTREELVVVLAGRAEVLCGDTVGEATAGDLIVVPPDTDFAVGNAGDEPLRLLACMPIAGQARLGGEATTLPWMQ